MSLINQMLRDLESRRAIPVGAGVASLAADAGTPVVPVQGSVDGPASNARRWRIVTIVLLAMLSGLLLWSSQPPWQERVLPVDAASARPVLSVPVIPVADMPTGPVMVTPIAAPPVATEKSVAEPVSRPKPVELPSPVSSPKPSVPDSQSALLSPQSAVPAPVVDTRVNKRIRPLNHEQRAEQALRRGVGLLGQGRQAEAELALHEALQLAPRQLRAREILAALYFNRGRLNEAQVLLADGVRLSPRAAGLAQFYARLLADRGELTTALTVLQQASPALTENLDFHALLAALYQRTGQHEAAARVYHQLLAQRGTQATWWMGLGISLEALDDTTPALEAYVKAQQLGAGLNPQVLAYLDSRIRALAPRLVAAAKVVQKGE
ncbi:MAG TPA: hypothetical protein ENI94_09425 [Gammaproteobacteria bacterium]|nr:hypothetical protein [Gammaproteobacteria bacterium]